MAMAVAVCVCVCIQLYIYLIGGNVSGFLFSALASAINMANVLETLRLSSGNKYLVANWD